MSDPESAHDRCDVCGRDFQAKLLTSGSDIRSSLSALIRKDVPGWSEAGLICPQCLQRYRQLYLTQILADETGELGELETEVATALHNGRLLTLQTAPDEEDEKAGFGARMADRVAEWGGSWTFILCFFAVLVVWMAVNVAGVFSSPFDPYPFILLNLLLSCVAAFQAPVIMMSQRRQEAKDRQRAENDYQINLKSELELRLLHDKIDHQLTHQWRRLLEIQRIQIDLLHEMRREFPAEVATAQSGDTPPK